MFRRLMLVACCLWLMCSQFAVAVDADSEKVRQDSKPNFVVLFLDDAGYGDFGCFGHPTIRTPNIDQMASQGMKLTQFYSASPACSASRYGLLTGRYPVRSGFDWVLYPKSKRGIHPDEITLAEALREKGYATACFGKWHLGSKRPFLPLQNGFDEYFGLPYSNDMQAPDFIKLPLIDGNETVELEPDQGLLTRKYTHRTIDFIKRHKTKPFFAYVPYTMPHLPLHTNEKFRGQSQRGLYGDVIEEIDWSVGQILETLRREGLAENTFVLLTSDNGPWIIKNQEGGSAGLFRDGKGSTWEGGVRVPAIGWWPDKIAAGSVNQNVNAAIDVFPTLLELAGGRLPTDRVIDGRSFADQLSAPSKSLVREPLFYYGPGNRLRAVRRGDWKLHVKTSSQTGKKYFNGKLPLLFQLGHDPSEQYELSDANPQIVEQLKTCIEEFQTKIDAESTFWKRSGTKLRSKPSGKTGLRTFKRTSAKQTTAALSSGNKSPFLKVLGIAQDAGFPQAGCQRRCCLDVWNRPELQKSATSLAVFDPASKQRWLFECTPNFPRQLHAINKTMPRESGPLVDGILLTHAHIGHYTGLMFLGREVIGADQVPVYCMPRMSRFLNRNGPWSQLIKLNNIEISPLESNHATSLNDRIQVVPIQVPHRDEFSETVALKIIGPNKSVLFLPDIDKWDRWENSIENQIDELDVVYIDGTFFDADELPGRDMSEIPHPFVVESVKRFSSLSKQNRSKIRFIHLNHTNPLLQPDSVELTQLQRAGMKCAVEGEVVGL